MATDTTHEFPALPDEGVPIPARFWWLKRMVIAAVLFASVFVAVRVIVGRRVDRMARERFDAYRARGERLLLADYRHAPPPEGTNAADFLTQASIVLSNAAQSPAYAFDGTTYPIRAFGLPAALAALERDTAALALVRKARASPEIDWRLKYDQTAISMLLPHLSAQRMLAHRLADAAICAHTIGDDAAAVDYLRDLVFIGRAADAQPFVVSHLVAVAIDALAASTVQSCVPTLAIEGPAAVRPATREQVRGLLTDLLDDQFLQAGLAEAVRKERTFAWDTCEAITDGRLDLGALARTTTGIAPVPGVRPLQRIVLVTLSPIVKRDAIEFLDYDTAVAAAAAKADYPSASAALPAPPGAMPSPSRSSSPLRAVMTVSFNRIFLTHYREVSARRVAAIAVAARLYQADHGRAPATIAEMIPEQLPEAPLDPLAGGGKRMTLRMRAAAPSTVPVKKK